MDTSNTYDEITIEEVCENIEVFVIELFSVSIEIYRSE